MTRNTKIYKFDLSLTDKSKVAVLMSGTNLLEIFNRLNSTQYAVTVDGRVVKNDAVVSIEVTELNDNTAYNSYIETHGQLLNALRLG